VAKRPPDAATRARSGRIAGGRRLRGCPDAGHAGPRPVRVLCPPCGRPSKRSSGRPVSTRPVSTRPVPSRCPDGWASGIRGSAAALSAHRAGPPGMARCGGPSPLGAMGSTCRRGPRAAWSPARIGPDGNGWSCVGPGWLARGSPADLGPPHRTPTGWGATSPPGRQGSWSAPGVPVGWLGSTRTSRCSPVPPLVRPGQVAGVVPDHGPGQGGGDHAPWSLGW
jgi:hypothetical protein